MFIFTFFLLYWHIYYLDRSLYIWPPPCTTRQIPKHDHDHLNAGTDTNEERGTGQGDGKGARDASHLEIGMFFFLVFFFSFLIFIACGCLNHTIISASNDDHSRAWDTLDVSRALVSFFFLTESVYGCPDHLFNNRPPNLHSKPRHDERMQRWRKLGKRPKTHRDLGPFRGFYYY